MQTKFTEKLENRKFCKERVIRMSGVAKGRPPKNIDQEQKKQDQLDERLRNHIEGKFGQPQRGFSLQKVMTKLSVTSTTPILITFLVINLYTILKEVFYLFFLR